MKKVIFLALLLPSQAFCQISENFESGNSVNWIQSSEGSWKADTTTSLSGKYSLHHVFDNPDAGTDRTGINIKNLHPSQGITRWSFLVRYGCDPSSSNNWSVFLMSDAAPADLSLEGGSNGFAIGVNLNGYDDTLRLWKLKGNQISAIINCRINWQTEIGILNTVKVSVERSTDGKWSVSVNRLTGELIRTSSGSDKELFRVSWFEVFYKYSSARDRLIWLDDIKIDGTFYEDVKPPVITGCRPAGKNSVVLTLNEEPSPLLMTPENISINSGNDSPYSVIKEDNLTYCIKFTKPFVNRSINTLIINKICDLSGNCDEKISIGFMPMWAETGDILISEIMSDPLPQVALPAKEYIEITNRAAYPVDLKNWRLYADGQYSLFPARILNPSGILIVCQMQDTLLFGKYGESVGLKQFPSLTDDGRILLITDSVGTLIHGIEYSRSWFRNGLKSRGGWSLEIIDKEFPFFYKENWKESDSRNGGTPGKINSVNGCNPDVSFPGITNVFPVDSLNINVIFSEPVLNLPGLVNDIKIGKNVISNIYPDDPLFRRFSIKLMQELKKNILYEFIISPSVTDFAGNRSQRCNFSFGLVEIVEAGDVLFNEILFDPWPGDQDFIELYNASEKIVDVSKLQIISVNDATGEKSETVPVSGLEKCFLPGDYYAVSTDIKSLSERYSSANSSHVFEIESFPTMPDDKGHLVLFNRELDKVDEMQYSDKMHFSLLTDHEGVSLEKTDPHFKSGESSNWHSATESSGWGTPGAPNSVLTKCPGLSDSVILSSSKISPDSDGYEDFLVIKFNLSGNSNMLSLTVFDEAGNFVRKLASNLNAGSSISILWDGTDENGSIVKTGIYIILIKLFDEYGKTALWKKACTVIRN